ncbi:MAG TPA: hypothetical protein VFP33_06450 [Gallionella sp.]|nr:hypothetical protein [Gallionella sp.]
MNQLDRKMALDIIEDALTCMTTSHGRGVAAGLCGAFYMCGVLTTSEWRDFLKRIPPECGPPRSTDDANESVCEH